MSTTTLEASISSLELIRLINHCRERQAHASGVSFPSQTFPRIEHADIQQKVKELLGATSKSSAYIFSPRQAHVVSSGYGPFVQDALFDFFEQQQMPKVEPTKTQATHSAPVASKLSVAMGAAVTMTSLQIVDYINSSREAGKAELRHDNFMAKVPKVLGEAAPKFLGTGFYTNGTGSRVERSIYIFPKQEACLMAMSYKLKPETMMALMELFQADAAPVALYQGASTEGNAPSAPVRKAKIELPLGGGDGVSMSSLEISELTGSRHDKVKQSIERLAAKGVITFPPMGEKSSTGGRPSTEFVFTGDKGRRDSIIVVAQLCPEFTATIVDRWQELEALYQSEQQTAPAMPYGQMPVPMSQMFSMFSEGYGKLEHQLQQQAADIASLKATVLQLQRPAPKSRKDPNRIPGPLDWQLAKTIQSIRFNFSIAPHEIGLERFYLYLHGLKTEGERADALRTALHLGIKLDNTMPTDFPIDAKTIRFKFCVSETDTRLKDVLDMLIGLPDDKARRTSLKRYLVAKSTNAPTFNLSVSLAPQHKQEQPGLF